MMRTVTSRLGRGFTAAVLTVLTATGACAAVAVDFASASGDSTVVSKPCFDPKDPACGPANGWQEKPKS
ncbi:hypothetical protein [Streptomyces xanthii]|uniref:Uncharacterized protein n=1 Tax=Streptomyces xanthii TaxID=2768069 RepID=A0A7H1BHT5_9ACTN|nr:hypothetical protein [Streptomyces xanthii]QNS08290.1 hypothetical protein IAG42_34930 [Streptomyces xanthii]